MKSSVKHTRSKKKQLWQFMTPTKLTDSIIEKTQLKITDKILEPSFWEGNFIFSIIEKLIKVYKQEWYSDEKEIYQLIFSNNIYGVELDEELYQKTIEKIKEKYGVEAINLFNNDFLLQDFNHTFDYVIGNPPFGWTINIDFQDQLDKKYGLRYWIKIKKETYSFFIIKSLDLLKENGKLIFILSDTFLTINTMKWLRNVLLRDTNFLLEKISYFSEETNYWMVVLKAEKTKDITENISIFWVSKQRKTILSYPNYSFSECSEYDKYFNWPLLSEYILCSAWMTVGKNEYFIREIKIDENWKEYIEEPYNFSYFQDPITLEKEIAKARLWKISQQKREQFIQAEEKGETVENVNIEEKNKKERIDLPNKDYALYNKAINDIIYSRPRFVIYWKEDWKAIYTYKKNWNWYLNGIGWKKFFGKEWFVWSLRWNRITARYLPKWYILDVASPLAILKEGIEKDELYFILWWLLSDLANKILKNIINHTLNIQWKDIERLPYPFWINKETKLEVIKLVKESIDLLLNNQEVDKKEVLNKLNLLFA